MNRLQALQYFVIRFELPRFLFIRPKDLQKRGRGDEQLVDSFHQRAIVYGHEFKVVRTHRISVFPPFFPAVDAMNDDRIFLRLFCDRPALGRPRGRR
jgi:hypothetical protein